MIGATVELHRVRKKYGSVEVVTATDLLINRGEFFALLGPSGSGKSTILGAIAGFVPLTSGKILVNGADITGVPPHRRNLGMVFQSYSLFPFLSVGRNVAFPLEMRGVAKSEIKTRVERMLAAVRLLHLADRLPTQLSGGQQQRVALARAAVYDPPLLLMDEPLGALDKNLREELQAEIKQFHKQVGATIIYVTHDQHEAASMADRIAILKDGRLEQVGTPRSLYHTPRNAFIAGFLGEANLFDIDSVIPVDNQSLQVETSQRLSLKAAGKSPAGPSVVCIRPEAIRLSDRAAAEQQNCFSGDVIDVVHAAGSMRYRIKLNDACILTVRVPNERRKDPLELGEQVSCSWDLDDTLIIPKQ